MSSHKSSITANWTPSLLDALVLFGFLSFFYHGQSCSSSLSSGEIRVSYFLIMWEKQQVKDLQSSQFMQPEREMGFLTGKIGTTVELFSYFSLLTLPPCFFSSSWQYVLAVGSSVFHAMFYGELAENKDEIHIPDVEPAAFLAMLK